MSDRSRKWLFQGASLVIAGVLLFLALRGVDIKRVGSDITNGAYIWVGPLILITILSHAIRAWRWTLLLDVLPEMSERSERISTFSAFKSIMIGYMANYAAPRLGEVVRTGHMAARSDLLFASVFGTVIAERILDLITLSLALVSLPFLLGPRLDLIREQLALDRSAYTPSLAAVIVSLTAVAVIIAVVAVAIRRRRRAAKKEPAIARWVAAARDGVASISRTGKPIQLIVATFTMWVCYALMGYWPFYIFGMTRDYGLTFGDGWSLMLLGSLGVLIPSPGGIGTYHYIAITALVSIWSVSQTTAASYAIFTHGGQLILYVALGFAVLIIDGASWSDLTTSRTKKDDETATLK